MRSRGGRVVCRRTVVVVRARGGGVRAGGRLPRVALEDPGVPLPHMVDVYGGATSKRGVGNVLCSVWGGVRLCQLVTHVNRNSWRMVLAVSKESFVERPPQAS
jgi:hypothetical protein